MAVYEEELFSVFKVNSEDEAFHIANDAVFGLGAAVFTQNREHAEHVASEKF